MCLFVLTKLCYRIDYHNLLIKSLVERLNSFLTSYFKTTSNSQDKEYLNSIKIPSIYFRILVKFWKKKEEDCENNFYVKLNCFPSYFLKSFPNNYNSYSTNFEVKGLRKCSTSKQTEDSLKDFKGISKSSLSCTRLKAKDLLVDNVGVPSSVMQKKFILEEFSLYFNTKLMKWRSSILSLDKSIIKCRICEKDMYPSDLCLHTFQCSRKNFFSYELKKLNSEMGEMIFMANDILK